MGDVHKGSEMAADKPAYCKMADAVASGTLDSAKTEDEWRGLCPGSQIGSSGVILPACDACPRSGEPARHEDDRCATCWDWEPDVEKVEVLGEPRCADPTGCTVRVVKRYIDTQGLDFDLSWAEGQGKPKAAKEGRCEYSGAKTRGAPFSPGGDLLLKALLIDIDTRESGMELAYRGWGGSEKELAIVSKRPEEARAWMTRRINARWQAITSMAARSPAAIRDIIASPTPKEDPGPPTPEQWAKLDAAPAPKKPAKRGRKK